MRDEKKKKEQNTILDLIASLIIGIIVWTLFFPAVWLSQWIFIDKMSVKQLAGWWIMTYCIMAFIECGKTYFILKKNV